MSRTGTYIEQDFVEFVSPGTFVSETTMKPIEGWDVEKAQAMATEITERHNARPFGFRFHTRRRDQHELDSRVIKTSPMYYLSGRIETLADVERRADPKESILLSNMRCNNIERILVTTAGGYKSTLPLTDDDIILLNVEA